MLKMFELNDDIFFPSTYDAIGVYEEEIGGGEEGPDGQVFTVDFKLTSFQLLSNSLKFSLFFRLPLPFQH